MQRFGGNVYSSGQTSGCDYTELLCTISVNDGVITSTTQLVTTSLGFPKDMWVGRSIVDFIHPKDHNTFSSKIVNGAAMQHMGTLATDAISSDYTMGCRIRRYKSLSEDFAIKTSKVSYKPFLLKLSFKEINKDERNTVCSYIEAASIYSAYNTPNEYMPNTMPFVIKHSAAGVLEYIDTDSIPYLGYLPQDIQDKDALHLYHPDDIPYLKNIYERILKEGKVSKSIPYRMLTNNGEYIKLETEWSSFVNPWSKKLICVIGKHYVVQGPVIPDVFETSFPTHRASYGFYVAQTPDVDGDRESIRNILQQVIQTPAKKTKQLMSRRCYELVQIMETLILDESKLKEPHADIQELDFNAHSAMMNEQLQQLCLDLPQEEGAAQQTLEGGSSSSSCDKTCDGR